MREDHFKVWTLPSGGNDWTLPRRLGEMLGEAEIKYGSRDESFTVLGVEFGPDGWNPHIYYPPTGKHITIMLAPIALNDHDIALYELAHECVHLLGPPDVATTPATVLEEGLATVFQEDYMAQKRNRYGMTSEPKYIAAAADVRQLLSIEPDAIKMLRNVQPSFSKMTLGHFSSLLPSVDNALVQKLLAPF